ncbi:hypothetical protein O7602_16005 [Micromonospora sp. WMMD1128]|uniref:Rv0361 family membrane protein n=1 Tax=Micromonospora sp. WMMD1128 TaxID=3015150 RepID=UPI00248C58DF|nr:hypothetical protein [Micromonospora sp. WMMD1128]WBB71265.1 hypothetical protein O7602_16005 [Micromonospora sp. WMMD1128]
MSQDPDRPVPPGEPTPEPAGPPEQPPPATPPPATPPPAGPVPQPGAGSDRWKRLPVVPLVIAGVVLLAACGVGAFLLLRGGGSPKSAGATDETRIRGVVGDFAAAVDRHDQTAILGLLCAEEAEEFRADDDFEPSREPLAESPSLRPVDAADIRVTGDTASAEISRPGQRDVTLHFRREDGAWKVCAPAGDAVTPSPSTATS